MIQGAAEFLGELLPEPVTPVHEVGEQVADRVLQVGARLPLKFSEGGGGPEGAVGVAPVRVWWKW